MLKITKIFNNNALQTIDLLGTELVVLGKGIAFGKKVGDYADEQLVEKTFAITKNPFSIRLLEILEEIPSDYFRLTNQIVNQANQRLSTQLSQMIYVSLTDHLFHAVQRAQKGQNFGKGLSYEIRRLYRTEYQIGLDAVAQIQQQFDIQMDEDEAAFIALHIFNARTDADMQETYRTTQIIKDILNIVSHHFHQQLNEESYDYTRFVTHLQHFAFRLFQPQTIYSSHDDFLYTQTQIAYPEAFRCVEKIARYLQNQFNKALNHDEQLYLIIHIQRVIGDKR